MTSSPGYYLRLLVAASRGIGGRPIMLGDIDLGASFDEMIKDLEVGRTRPDELSVEQLQIWGALCVYGVTRCRVIGRDCAVLRGAYTPSQLKAIRRGVDVLRAREIAGAVDTAGFVEELSVVHENQDHAGTDQAAAVEPPVVEVETRPSVGNLHRIRLRISSHTAWDETTVMAAVLSVRDDPTAKVVIMEARHALVTNGVVAVRLTAEWEEVAFQLRGRGVKRTCTIDVAGVEGWRGTCAIEVAPLDSARE